MKRERLAVIEALERLGLLKYVVTTLFAGIAFVLVAGAFYYEELGHRPPPPPPVVTLPPLPGEGPPLPGYAMRARVSRDVRFTTDPQEPAGFSFYDIVASETPHSLGAKLVQKQFRMGRGRGDGCNFAFPLSGQLGDKDVVAAFIRDRSRECCAVAEVLPGQLVTYPFFRADAKSPTRQAGPIAGAAVFSEVAGGLLTLNLRFSDDIPGYEASMTNELTEKFGPPVSLGKAGLVWARDGGLVTMVRSGRSLSVTAYYAANIDRHTATTIRLAAKPADTPEVPSAEPRTAAGRLALAVAP